MISTDPRHQTLAEHIHAWLLVRSDFDAMLTAALYELGPMTPNQQAELIDAILEVHAAGCATGGSIRLIERRLFLQDQPRIRLRPQRSEEPQP